MKRMTSSIHGQNAAKKATIAATGKLSGAQTGSNISGASMNSIASPAIRSATGVTATLMVFGVRGTLKVLATFWRAAKLLPISPLGVL